MRLRVNYRMFLCGILIAVMIISCCLFVTTVGATDQGYQKIDRTYEIAVVYDNSGSMYENDGWCRAKYSMEIFASMLDYADGDKLWVVPMWGVTTDGKTSGNGSFSPILIDSADDINNKISKMYTPVANGTPYQPVKEAYNILKKSKASDKWLVVLTDGNFDSDNRNQSASVDVQQRLNAIASDNIKVQLLGFGDAKKIKDNPSKGFYAADPNVSLEKNLIEVCNRIFNRTSLSVDKYLSDNTLTLPMSMRSLIVFIQGPGAEVESLEGPEGESIDKEIDYGQRKASNISTGDIRYPNPPAAKDLAGHVVTFGECPVKSEDKAQYALSYSGNKDNIQIFYEPDVSITVELINNDGQVVDPDENKISAGTYELDYYIVDNVSKVDVTHMLGDVSLIPTVTKSDGTTVEIKDSTDSNGNKIKVIELTPDDDTKISVEGKYLEDYTIKTDDSAGMFDFEVVYPELDKLDVKATVEQSNSWYKISDHENWKPIRIDLTYNGEKLTDEQMAALQIEIPEDERISYSYEAIPGESAFNVYVGQESGGKFVEPSTGIYTMKFTASAKDYYDRTVSDSDTSFFEVRTYSAFWRWLIYLIVLVIIILAIVCFLMQKVLPKNIVLESGSTAFELDFDGLIEGVVANVRYSKKGKNGTLTVSTPSAVGYEANCSVTMKLKAEDKRYVPSKDRRVCITDISAKNAYAISINSVPYERDEETRRWVKVGTLPGSTKPINHVTKISMVEISGGSTELPVSTLRCRVKHM